jgi:transposase-like protein
MLKQPKTLQEATLYFADPDNCIDYLADRRWPDGKAKCPTCGREDVSYVAKRRVWQCKSRHAKCQFSIKVGTIFEDSAIGLDKWLLSMWMIANCRNGVSSWEIHRTVGITQKSAWFVLHRIRLALKKDHHTKTGGEGHNLEADESWIGGQPRFKHKSKAQKAPQFVRTEWGTIIKNPAHRSQARSERYSEKTPVMGILNRNTREIRAKVLPQIGRETLQNEILDNVSKGSRILTDEHKGYKILNARGFIHESVNHMQEYVRNDVHTNGLENFWSLLKRGLRGTYVAVEPFHLDRYLDEQVFRYNNRTTKDNPLTDADRFALAVSQIVGKRLTYAQLTGKEEGWTRKDEVL